MSAFFSSFGVLMAHSHEHGNDVVVALDHDDQLVFEHVHVNGLTAHDFPFV